MSAFAKAVVPSVLALVAILVHLIITGELNEVDLEAAIMGVLTSITVYLVPNAPQDGS